MGDVRQRVAKLEVSLDDDKELCFCGGRPNVRVVYDAATWPYTDRPPEPEPELCPVCGKPRLSVRVVFDRRGDADAGSFR